MFKYETMIIDSTQYHPQGKHADNNSFLRTWNVTCMANTIVCTNDELSINAEMCAQLRYNALTTYGYGSDYIVLQILHYFKMI